MSASPLQRIGFIIVWLLIAIGIFSSDSYLPSLPSIVTGLHTNDATVRLTIGLYLLGLGIGPLILGPLSDQYGRRTVLLGGLGLAMASSLLCCLAPNIHCLIIGRLIQGFGMASGMTLGRAILSDLFLKTQLARISAYLGMGIGLVPVIAPTIGGYIETGFGWRANFVLLFLLVGMIWTIVWRYLPETNTQRTPRAAHPTKTLPHYATLLRRGSFMVYPIQSAASYGSIMVYLTISPFLFQKTLSLSPVAYGWLSIVIGAAIVCGAFLNTRLMRHFTSHQLLLTGSLLSSLTAGLMGLIGWLGWSSVPAIMIPMFFYMLILQLVMAHSFSNGISKAPAGLTGLSSALFSSVQLGLSALFSAIAAWLPTTSAIPMATLMCTLGFLAFCFTYYTHRQPVTARTQNPNNHPTHPSP